MDIRYTTGSEGPMHDPYHYEEWSIKHTSPTILKTLTNPDLKITIHRGLGEWFQLNTDYNEGTKFHKHHNKEVIWDKALNGYLEHVFGYNLTQIERIYRKVNRPFCKECKVYPRGYDIDILPGYPGEEVYFHRKCGNPVGSSQDMSYVI